MEKTIETTVLFKVQGLGFRARILGLREPPDCASRHRALRKRCQSKPPACGARFLAAQMAVTEKESLRQKDTKLVPLKQNLGEYGDLILEVQNEGKKAKARRTVQSWGCDDLPDFSSGSRLPSLCRHNNTFT